MTEQQPQQLHRPRIFEDDLVDAAKSEFQKFRVRADEQEKNDRALSELLERLVDDSSWELLDDFDSAWHKCYKHYALYSLIELRELVRGLRAREDKRDYFLSKIRALKTQTSQQVGQAISLGEQKRLRDIEQAKEALKDALERARLTEAQIARDKKIAAEYEAQRKKDEAERLAQEELARADVLQKRAEEDRERREREQKKKSLVDKFLGKKESK
jgi:hypothetical protein